MSPLWRGSAVHHAVNAQGEPHFDSTRTGDGNLIKIPIPLHSPLVRETLGGSNRCLLRLTKRSGTSCPHAGEVASGPRRNAVAASDGEGSGERGNPAARRASFAGEGASSGNSSP